MTNSPPNKGLIWITGFSSSGKTTIARLVYNKLKNKNLSVIHLDGDDLRSIFGDIWGYDRKSRIELAKIYFRLCNALIEQGQIVIISAIAMFDDLFDWTKKNIPYYLQVFLDVPEEERKERDNDTKRIFVNKELNDDFYNIPKEVDLRVNNYGENSPAMVAEKIIQSFFLKQDCFRDLGREEYWNSAYSEKLLPKEPSEFARFVFNQLDNTGSILEAGCGNGRDANLFASKGLNVFAIDPSEAAIKSCKANSQYKNLSFFVGRINEIDEIKKVSFCSIYSRFVLHAMPEEEESSFLEESYNLLNHKGQLFIECRSNKDEFAKKGDYISPNERSFGHYRRFIDIDNLIKKLKDKGFDIKSKWEDRGFAKFNSEDPIVIRIVAQKNELDLR